MKTLGNVVTTILLVGVGFQPHFVDATTRTFKDDLGVTHTFTKKKPKVVAWSHIAISLAHLGTLDLAVVSRV